MKLVKRKDGSEKCPNCGTVFIQSMHPFDVKVRRQIASRRKAKRAKKA